MEKVDPRAVYLCFCINSFTGQQLKDVSSAKCRLYNTETLNEVASLDITNNQDLSCTAMLMCILYRSGPKDEWYMYAVGEPAQGVFTYKKTISYTLFPSSLNKITHKYNQQDRKTLILLAHSCVYY